MKKHFLSKITAVFLSVLMIFSLCACNLNAPQTSSYPKNGEKKIITASKDFYSPTGQTEPFNLAYYENEEEVVLVEIKYAVSELLSNFILAMSGDSISVDETETKIILTRNNQSYCELDFVEDTVYFSDFDSFSSRSYDANPHDLLAMAYTNEEGKSEYFERGSSFFTPGYAILIDLAERNIPLDIYDGKKYIPLQTFNDLFICPFGINIAYNGEDLFAFVGNTVSDAVADIYYGRKATNRSTALAQFNYNELCLFLDLYYGLQNEHGFTDGFDYYLDSIGLKEQFLKPDATNSFNAIGTLTLGYIADLHSSIVGASPYLGAPRPSEGADVKVNPSYLNHFEIQETYETTRAMQLGDQIEFYYEVGNTAFITFDYFTLARSGNYEVDKEQTLGDTIAIISTAHKLIMDNDGIENVVLDLSCNGGGAVDSAIYTVAWMLGYCDFSIYDSATGSRSSINYKADVNFDGEFDEEDTVASKNLYCLVSPVSFSCGNLVPALLKESGKVTIVGKTSSGGGCVVRHGVTADGTTFNISNSKQFTTVKNGTHYGVDQGVEPDIVLTKIESFYDRYGLADLLNNVK